MNKEYAEYLLNKTKEDYNLIADDFSRTRSSIPEDFKNWLNQYIIFGEKVLDWGCGNGRFCEIFKDTDYYGVDVSEKLIKVAKTQHPKAKFQVINLLDLPFPDNFFDKIICLAVLHHIPSEEFRIQFLKEGKRVLKPEGTLILTVWNLNPFRTILIGKWYRVFPLLTSTILKIFGISKLDFKDFFLPWRISLRRIIGLRYFHWFSVNETEKLVQRIGFKIKECGVLKFKKSKETNIYLIAEK